MAGGINACRLVTPSKHPYGEFRVELTSGRVNNYETNIRCTSVFTLTVMVGYRPSLPYLFATNK